MKITVFGRHLVITDPINDYAVKKMEKLDKYFDNLGDITVTLSAVKLKKGPSHTAEVIANANGNILKAVATENDLYVAIDKAANILEGHVISHRTFKFDPVTNTVSAEATKKVVKVALEAKPMNLEEAILQMEALGKDFYVFFNCDTEEMNVIYRKRNGNYGHIEPTLEK